MITSYVEESPTKKSLTVEIPAEQVHHFFVGHRQHSGEGRALAVHPLHQNRSGRLAQRAPCPLEAHGRHAGVALVRLEVQRHDVAASGIAAGHAHVGTGQHPLVARASGVVHQPGEPRFPIRHGRSIGART